MIDDLGPLPEPYLSATATALALGENVRQPLYTADQLRAERERCYALGVAAERERWWSVAFGLWHATKDAAPDMAPEEYTAWLALGAKLRELEGG